MARIHPSDALQRRPRLPDDLADRIDAARGDVSLTRWVVRACELRLAGALEAAQGGPTGSRVEVPGVSPPAPAPPPRAPRKPRTPKERPTGKTWTADEVEKVGVDPTPEAAPEPPETPEPGDEQSPDQDTPSVVQLAQRCGVTLSMARRWLESGEWAMYWP